MDERSDKLKQADTRPILRIVGICLISYNILLIIFGMWFSTPTAQSLAFFISCFPMIWKALHTQSPLSPVWKIALQAALIMTYALATVAMYYAAKKTEPILPLPYWFALILYGAAFLIAVSSQNWKRNRDKGNGSAK